jgi:nucleolar protein 12
LISDIEEEPVRKHFSDCGEIDNVRIIRDKKSCLGKGFGFVTFKVNIIMLVLNVK